jgi:hypothetical protein
VAFFCRERSYRKEVRAFPTKKKKGESALYNKKIGESALYPKKKGERALNGKVKKTLKKVRALSTKKKICTSISLRFLP